MNNVYPGMIVRDATGPIGVVDSVQQDAGQGGAQVLVRGNNGDMFVVAPDMFMVEGDTLRIAPSAAQSAGFPNPSFDPNRTQVLPTDTLSASRAMLGNLALRAQFGRPTP